MTRSLLLTACLLAALPAHAADVMLVNNDPCVEVVAAFRVQATLTAGEAAFGRSDDASVASSLEQARRELACVQEQITPSLAAQIHRVEGLSLMVANKRKRAAMAFAAARSAEPSYRFPKSIAPEESPAADQYTALRLTGATEPLPKSKYGMLFIDGQARKERSTETPSIVQVLDRTGANSHVSYLWPNDAPSYLTGSSRTPLQNGLLVGGTSAAGLGAAIAVTGYAITAPSGDKGPFTILDQGPQRAAFAATGGSLMALGVGGIVSSFLIHKDR